MDAMGSYSEKPLSDACSTRPVRRLEKASGTFAGNRIVFYLGVAGEIPARESSAALFGWRYGRCPVVRGYSSIFKER